MKAQLQSRGVTSQSRLNADVFKSLEENKVFTLPAPLVHHRSSFILFFKEGLLSFLPASGKLVAPDERGGGGGGRQGQDSALSMVLRPGCSHQIRQDKFQIDATFRCLETASSRS